MSGKWISRRDRPFLETSSGSAGDGAKDAADGALLLPNILELTGVVRAVPRDAGHSVSLGCW
jgi:hypothetical protein